MTWGERMLLEAARIRASLGVELSWMRPLARYVEQRGPAGSAPTPERFARSEALPAPPRKIVPALAEPAPLDDGAGSAPSSSIRERLVQALGPAAAAIRVHTGPHADATARTHHADAVTIREHIFFRDGRYRPEERTGAALLLHEATHAIEAQRPDISLRRSTRAGLDAEERLARMHEQRALAPRAPALAAPPRAAAHSLAAPSHAAVRPMAADVDRAETPPDESPVLDVRRLKEELHRELLAKIRTDFERGG